MFFVGLFFGLFVFFLFSLFGLSSIVPISSLLLFVFPVSGIILLILVGRCCVRTQGDPAPSSNHPCWLVLPRIWKVGLCSGHLSDPYNRYTIYLPTPASLNGRRAARHDGAHAKCDDVIMPTWWAELGIHAAVKSLQGLVVIIGKCVLLTILIPVLCI